VKGDKKTMNPFLRLLIKFDDFLAKGEAAVLIALVSVMTVIVFLQVVYRYLLTQPLVWSEELARYLFVWLSLLGAALALQKRGHFGFEILYQKFSSPKRQLLGFLIHLLIGLLLVILLSQGITLVEKTAQQESPAMGIAMGWAYACIPVAAALMLFHLIIIFFKDGLKEQTTEPQRAQCDAAATKKH
jgi:TRAP-type C4-dicarboxylate transport system permease small subunit